MEEPGDFLQNFLDSFYIRLTLDVVGVLPSNWSTALEGGGPMNGLQSKLQTMTEKKPARRVGAKPPPDRAQKSMGCLSLKNPLR